MTVSRLSCKTHLPYTWSTQCQTHTHTGTNPMRRYVHVKCQVRKHFKQSKSRLNRGSVCVCVCGDVSVCVCVVSQPVSSNLQVKGTPRQVPDRQNSRRCPGFHTELGRHHTTQHCVVASSFHSIPIPGFHHPLA